MNMKSRCLAAIVLLGAMLAIAVPALAGSYWYDYYLDVAWKAKGSGDAQGMEKALVQAHRFGPGTEYTWRSLAWAQAGQGKWQESLVNARKNIKLHGETGWTLEQLAESAICAGDFKLAADTLAKADSLSTDLVGTAKEPLEGAKARLLSMTGQRVYQLRWKIDNGDDTTYRLLLPQLDTPRQQFTYTVSNAASWKTVKDGRRDFAEITQKPGEPCYVNGTLTLHASNLGRMKLTEKRTGEWPAEAKGCFGPFKHVVVYDPASPVCAKLAASLKGSTDVETVQNILNWMNDHMTYDGTAVTHGLDDFLVVRKGVCHHWCSGFTALARAAGVPAVVAHGIAMPNETSFTDATGSHGWSEVYLIGLGWVPIEPLNRNSLALFGGKTYLTTDTANWTPEDDHFIYESIQGPNFSGRIVSDTP